MAPIRFSFFKANVLLTALTIALTLTLSLKAQTTGTTVYFDPTDSETKTAGGSGDFSSSDFFTPNSTTPPGTDAPFVSGTNEVGSFVPAESAVFNGPASTVSVSSAVGPSSLEIGVTSGTETFGTPGAESAIELPVGRALVGGGSDFLHPITVDAGSASVVFNSNVNLGIFNHYYSDGAFLNDASSGNVTFNGGITFTNYTTDGDNVGQPSLTFTTNTGATFTINSAVKYVEAAGSATTTNGNTPTILLNSSGSTVTLTNNASFSDVRVSVNAGTILDQGASISSPVYQDNYQIIVSGTGQYLTDTAGMTVTPNIVFGSGGGTIGGALAAETTFASVETVGYSGTSMDLTSAAGGRVDFTGDVHSGQGLSVVKVGAGTINMDDTSSRAEDQTGGWEIKNGTMLLNGTVANNTTITGSGLKIDQVATTALVPNVQTYAILGGNGSTAVHVTADGANSSISPGDPKTNNGIGTLTLSGGLSAGSGATFNFDLNGAKANGFDTVAFNGSNLTLGGTVTFNFTNLGGTLDSGPYNLLTGFLPTPTLTTPGGSSLAAAFVLNGPAGYIATLDPSDLLPGATNLAVDFTAEAIPEPSTWTIMLGGLVVLGFLVRRKSLPL